MRGGTAVEADIYDQGVMLLRTTVLTFIVIDLDFGINRQTKMFLTIVRQHYSQAANNGDTRLPRWDL